MKQLRTFVFALAAVSLLTIVSCGKKGNTPEPPGKETAEKLTAGDWRPAAAGITMDNAAREEWSNFVLRFTVVSTGATPFEGGSYTVSGLPTEADAQLVWRSQGGNWAFKKNGTVLDLTKIIRDPGTANEKEITVQVDQNTLRLSFSVAAPTARIEGFVGNWVFNLSNQ